MSIYRLYKIRTSLDKWSLGLVFFDSSVRLLFLRFINKFLIYSVGDESSLDYWIIGNEGEVEIIINPYTWLLRDFVISKHTS